MKTANTELSQKYMVLIKIDASNLYQRVKTRQQQYLETFSLKRDRAIFKNIFRSRYSDATLFDLSHLPLEVIEVSNDFYMQIDELLWYLMNTQDMPNTIEDEIIRHLHLVEKKYEILCLYVDAELSGSKEEQYESFNDIPPTNASTEAFLTQGEIHSGEEFPGIISEDDS